jgi:large subunit ribosomal protein L9
MEVILVEDVTNLGSIGALVKVAPGYGRNYLLPTNMAVLASRKNKAQLDHNMRIANFRKAKAQAAAEDVAKKINGLTVKIARKVGEQDKLYGSVTTHDVQAALAEKGVDIDRRKLDLHDAIKALGEYSVIVRLSGDVRATIKLQVVAE